jgi:hypothetical protein
MKKALSSFFSSESGLAETCVKKGWARSSGEATLALLILAGAFINFAALIYFANQNTFVTTASVVRGL